MERIATKAEFEKATEKSKAQNLHPIEEQCFDAIIWSFTNKEPIDESNFNAL